ncbi:hypothetical protein [Streptomyces sp. S584]|uniref:hypothetical protein n=1 Tax=Streptomyces sp. S584 TaxID=3096010 RepID=UPI002AFF7FA0|nr:hypothetical protein [Streptomyces sp. S584]
MASSAASRPCNSAPTAAAPITEPICRTVLLTPDAAPARWRGTFRMASVDMGAMMQPTPRPASRVAGTNANQAAPGAATHAMAMIPAA